MDSTETINWPTLDRDQVLEVAHGTDGLSDVDAVAEFLQRVLGHLQQL